MRIFVHLSSVFLTDQLFLTRTFYRRNSLFKKRIPVNCSRIQDFVDWCIELTFQSKTDKTLNAREARGDLLFTGCQGPRTPL